MSDIETKAVEVNLDHINTVGLKSVISRDHFERRVFLIHYYLMSITITTIYGFDLVIILIEKFKVFYQSLIRFFDKP